MDDVKSTDSQASENHEEVTNEAETSEETNSTGIDHKAELEKLRAEKEKKEKQLGQAEHVIEELKSKNANVDEESIRSYIRDEMKPLVESLESINKNSLENTILEHSSSADEAELIRFHLENSIKRTGNTSADVLNAKALANSARFSQQVSELERAKQESEAQPETSAGQKNDKPQTKVKLTAEDKKIMQVYGLTEEELRKGVR